MDAFTAIFTTSISTVTSSSEVPRNQEAHPGGMTLCVIA
ncbi:fungal mating-type pheromone [Cryptococcus neoformans]|uniref:Fungal mating-type pheromone n=24 Tax=Cryptococcus neoformans species complex TaxID=1897064 RepID=J9VJN8_CRYN9|nr:fungal mating-type pheromone [Cryptococcus neoformans var. grubii H99]AAN75185.1 MFalpha1 [Cryptococcus neoformans var. grubii]OWT39665.1 fungal mating-type pheromone [Cryptococcus neoformans var. grubii Bt1]OWZ32135.1 fungal mating-type pheromone [Cryptococcus neoformans var. grubii AD2-60a]OWZ44804.1 fungal mating-type pheromone [Cryptococcus neoformans var. grubii C23]OWZ45197.1 fungal mating-type pheromone [Cryptococcus neoformans var. grubii AD1-83a]OWZ48939.1 fungal mating-type phero|eukprot:XP_012049628.1 fungal mating-type pheromone [Cryptococcus neoformans var. grubii H99]